MVIFHSSGALPEGIIPFSEVLTVTNVTSRCDGIAMTREREATRNPFLADLRIPMWHDRNQLFVC